MERYLPVPPPLYPHPKYNSNITLSLMLTLSIRMEEPKDIFYQYSCQMSSNLALQVFIIKNKYLRIVLPTGMGGVGQQCP